MGKGVFPRDNFCGCWMRASTYRNVPIGYLEWLRGGLCEIEGRKVQFWDVQYQVV